MAVSARRASLAQPHCANDLDRNDRLAHWILARPLFMSSPILSPDRIVMISGAQIRAARALLRIDQRELAKLAGVSLPTIQRMETSAGPIRGVVESLTKFAKALDSAGIEFLGENAPSAGKGRGARLKQPRTVKRVYPPLRVIK